MSLPLQNQGKEVHSYGVPWYKFQVQMKNGPEYLLEGIDWIYFHENYQ